ncbi:MAG: DUF975 family protein [Oscillospiraceae bacterium]|nr:DUF975 family protein [Oscillospiraceae bacterium]
MFVRHFYKKAFEILKTLPWKLLGLMLLGNLLVYLAGVIGVLPVISFPVSMVLTAVTTLVFLMHYRGEETEAEQLFDGFKNFWHVAGGMCWMALWVFIWTLIPLAGLVFGAIKAYSYRFTPYILMTEPEIPPTQALKKSMALTEGHKGPMFLSHLGVFGICAALIFVFVLLSLIPFVGLFFGLIGILAGLAAVVAASLFNRVLDAAFYQELACEPEEFAKEMAEEQSEADARREARQSAQLPPQNPAGSPEPETRYCPSCGEAQKSEAKFCSACGTKL